MADGLTTCPVCGCSEEFEGTTDFAFDSFTCACPVCGRFRISREAVQDRILEDGRHPRKVQRAALSHRIRLANDAHHDAPVLTSEWLEEFVDSKTRNPSVSEQTDNIIRFIGDHVSSTGEPVPQIPISYGAMVGALSRRAALRLTKQLGDIGLVGYIDRQSHQNPHEMMHVDLTVAGWQRYEAERLGKVSGLYGFIALKFGDDVLERFLRDVVKPAVSQIGYTLTDIRDTARAGIIDNLLRVRIRDAAFVLVDLTHDNAGAYWEAGYAEGLGKPVLYLCERSKFEQAKTHFDTNHCTTVLWDVSEPERFQTELVATLRRSLELFPSR